MIFLSIEQVPSNNNKQSSSNQPSSSKPSEVQNTNKKIRGGSDLKIQKFQILWQIPILISLVLGTS